MTKPEIIIDTNTLSNTRPSLDYQHYDHEKEPLYLGPIGSDKNVTIGSKDGPGKTIVIRGDIGNGTTYKIYGWDLHVNGSIQKDVTIEFLDKNNSRNRVCIEGEVHNRVKIIDAYTVTVKGKIHSDSKIHALSDINANEVSHHVVLESQDGNINYDKVGAHSSIKAKHGVVSCRHTPKEKTKAGILSCFGLLSRSHSSTDCRVQNQIETTEKTPRL